MAADAASLRTVIDSISLGSRPVTPVTPCPFGPSCEKSPLCTGTPSTTYSGWFDAETDAAPRTRIAMPLPGSPAFCITCTPGALPCSAASTPATGWFCTSLAFTVDTAPVTRARFSVPYPITMTWASVTATLCNTKSTRTVSPAAAVTCRSAGENPMRCTRTVRVPGATFDEYVPRSLVTPRGWPAIVICAPDTAWPDTESVTVPRIVAVCCAPATAGPMPNSVRPNSTRAVRVRVKHLIDVPPHGSDGEAAGPGAVPPRNEGGTASGRRQRGAPGPRVVRAAGRQQGQMNARRA